MFESMNRQLLNQIPSVKVVDGKYTYPDGGLKPDSESTHEYK